MDRVALGLMVITALYAPGCGDDADSDDGNGRGDGGTSSEPETAGQCEDLGDTDCGGDLEGSWEVSVACVSLPPDFLNDEETGESPFGDCPGLVVGATIDVTGTVTFEADGSFALDTMQTADIAITVPKDCLPMGAECADLGDAESPAVDTGDACEVSMISEATNAQTGTYETEGNTFVTIDDAEMVADEPAPYCVRGDTITVQATSEDGAVTVFQATRQ